MISPYIDDGGTDHVTTANIMSGGPVSLDKKLIFTVSPGRSGTHYLAKLLATIPGVSSYHEPEPAFLQVMRKVQTHPETATAFLRDVKLPIIARCPTPVYAETSHLVCKGFIEPMLELGLRPALIIMRRPPRDVAWSMVERFTIPARTDVGLRFALSPTDPGVIPLQKWRTATHYQLCYWYTIEIERRQVLYTDMAKQYGLPCDDVTNRELNDWSVYARLLTSLDLPVTDAVKESHALVSSQEHNKNPRPLTKSDTLSIEEDGVWTNIPEEYHWLRDRIAQRYAL